MAIKKQTLLRFSERTSKDSKALTKTWNCFGSTGPFLGIVKWWPHWRRYCFFPEPNTLFDANCLFDIADFCANQTTEQKDDQARRRNLKKEQGADGEIKS